MRARTWLAQEWSRSTLAARPLAVEPQVFEPHKTERIVSTASAMQVREPINRRGIGSAEPYREHLKPFLDAYAA
jgi:hypothetical protein